MWGYECKLAVKKCFGKVEVVEASKGDTIGGLLTWKAFGGRCFPRARITDQNNFSLSPGKEPSTLFGRNVSRPLCASGPLVCRVNY